MDEQVGGRAFVERLRTDLPEIHEALRELPGIVRNVSEQLSHGDLRIRMDSPDLKAVRAQLEKQERHRFLLAGGATGVLAGTLVLVFAAQPLVGWLLVAGGALSMYAARPGK